MTRCFTIGIFSWARLVLAVTLLVGVCSNLVPLMSASADSTCKLACCVGDAPHKAGSCMGGTCQAPLKRKRLARQYPVETFCGAPRQIDSRVHLQPTAPHESTRVVPDSPASLCSADCSAAAANSGNFRNQKVATAAVMARADSLDPTGLLRLDDSRVLTSNHATRQSPPRGPPLKLS
jgi:hypothetical protein